MQPMKEEIAPETDARQRSHAERQDDHARAVSHGFNGAVLFEISIPGSSASGPLAS